jgi:hypothetical protein
MSKNYFIVEIGDDTLKNAGVEFSKMNIDGESGAVVDYENMQLLKLHGMNITLEKETSMRGMWAVKLDKSEPIVAKVEYLVDVDGWDGGGGHLFADVAKRILSPFVEKGIVISVPHGRSKDPRKDGKFHIWIWSSPTGDNEHICPEKMWDTRVECKDSVFYPSGTGIPIMDGEYAAGELVGDNLYIHHDICHTGRDTELIIFENILMKVVDELSASSPEEKIEKLKKLSRNEYILECFPGKLVERMRDMKKNVERMRMNILEYQKHTNEAIGKIVSMRGKRRILENTIKTAEDYGLEYDRFLKVGGVKDVLVVDGVIKVFTTHIYITPDKHPDTYDIGEFEMKISPAGEEKIKFFNLTRKGKGDNYNVHHPHVREDGSPCLGNIKAMLNKLFEAGNYIGVAQLGIQFLNHANLGDKMGIGILEYWPKVGEK